MELDICIHGGDDVSGGGRGGGKVCHGCDSDAIGGDISGDASGSGGGGCGGRGCCHGCSGGAIGGDGMDGGSCANAAKALCSELILSAVLRRATKLTSVGVPVPA
eukprot:2778123-Prymnesium_polylepis.1